jgi:hypothetical protein
VIADARLAAAARVGAWAIALAVAAGACRGLAEWLPVDLAMAVGLALSLGVPGWAVLRASGLRDRLGTAEAFGLVPAAGMVAWAIPLAAGVALELPFGALLVVVLAASAVGLGWRPPREPPARREPAAMAGLGLVLALACLQWQPPLMGDAMFHAGLMRKLLALPGISLSAVSPFLHGHPHAGYAFPLLQAVAAGACKLTGIDASTGYPHLAAAFAFFLPPAVWAGGRALAGTRVGALAALLAVWDVLSRNEVGFLNQPSFLSFLVLLPGFAVLLAAHHRRPHDRQLAGALAVATLLVAIIHPTYALPLLVILLAAVLVQPRTWPALAASALATACAFGFIWWVALRGAHRSSTIAPSTEQFMIWRGHIVALSGRQVMEHRPAFLLAALAAPVLLARDRRFALPAAMLASVLALVALPGMGLALTHLIGVGQSTRMWEAAPWTFVAALLIVLAAGRLRGRTLVAAAAGTAVASVVIEAPHWLWGDPMETIDQCPMPDLLNVDSAFSVANLLVCAIAVACVVAAVVALRRRRPLAGWWEPSAPVLALALLFAGLMAGPLREDGRAVADGVLHGKAQQHLVNQVSPQLVAFLRAHDTRFPVVLAPFKASYADWFTGIAYQLVGRSDVYAVAIAEVHTRANPKDDPVARRNAVRAFLNPATPEGAREAILARYRVTYAVLDAKTTDPAVLRAVSADARLRLVHRDPPTPADEGRFLVYARG